MPLPSSRMTKNQDRTIRYRAGYSRYEDDADEFDEESSEDEAAGATPGQPQPAKSAPAATTFPTARKLPVQPVAKIAPREDLDLDGFVTASESSSDEEAVSSGENEDGNSEQGSSEDSDSSEAESSSEEEAKPRLLAPTFISKAQRNKLQALQPSKSEDELAADEERRRQEKANGLLQAQIERDQAARAAGKSAWDDDDVQGDDVDDTDGLNPEAEYAAWKLRELKRIRRDREELVKREKELEEIERRRNLTAEEREAEDRELLEQQQVDQDGRGKMAYMQKYYHKGAFFQGDDEEDEEVKAVLSRDLAGARFVDETSKETLPEYMRIRDMTKLGRKGRTRYKDLKSEDTGKWGALGDRQTRNGDLDDRFQPDFDNAKVITGANSAPVGGRRRRDEGDGRSDAEKRARYT